MAKSFSQLMSRAGFANRDMSEPRVAFEFDDSELAVNPINGVGSNAKINAVNSGLLEPDKGSSDYTEPSLNVPEQNEISETGIPQPDNRDLMLEEFKRYPVTKRQLVDSNAKKFSKFSARELGQEEPIQ